MLNRVSGMSALGQKRAWMQARVMSALPPTAEIKRCNRDQQISTIRLRAPVPHDQKDQ